MTGLQIEIGQYTSDNIPNFSFNDVAYDKVRCDRYCQSQVNAADQLLGYVTTPIDTNVNVQGYHFGSFRTTPSIIQNGGTDSFKTNSEAATRGPWDTMDQTGFGTINGTVIQATGQGDVGYQGSTGYIWTGANARLLLVSEL
jgi:hypothetical protein